MSIDIEIFQAELPECEDYLLHSYINVCQAELQTRSERELQQAKNALSKCSKDQLFGVLFELGIEIPPEPAEKKSRIRKSILPFGYKEYLTEQGSFFVPKYFDVATHQSCVGSQAVFLQGLTADEKLQRFGTVQQLQNQQVQLAELVELGLVYVLQDEVCVVATLDMLPASQTTDEVAVKPKKAKQRQEVVEVEIA